MTDAVDRPIRVLLVDDHAVVRKGLRALFELEPGIEVVGEAGDGEQAVQVVERLRPDVILMDLEMPGLGGVEAARQISERQPSSKIVVLTSHAAEEDVFPALKAGALGYLLKHSAPDDVVRAIRQAHQGETVLHPAIARMVLQELNRPPQPRQSQTTEPLSARELEVLRLLARGMSNQEIADTLVVGEATVRSHVSAILRKLQLASRTQAALYALREGLASLGDADLPS
ncbi:MAG TPA: response regulator transcription factor [Chloroflexota bacterium]|nr:response regulator transcription factor [Chloroflexota bacterium]